MIHFSCREEGKVVDEGMIKYKIDYLDYDKSNILLNIMPEKMTVKFKDNNTRLEIESIYGVFRFAQISNKRKGLNITLLKIMDKKYKYLQNIDSIASAFKEMRNIDYQQTQTTQKIAGYKCKKVNVNIKTPDTTWQFPIYTTNEIAINQPNKNNPFHQLNEVLLEFRLTINDMRMRLTAEKIRKADIKKEEFVVPSDYKTVSGKEMQQIISRYTAKDDS